MREIAELRDQRGGLEEALTVRVRELHALRAENARLRAELDACKSRDVTAPWPPPGYAVFPGGREAMERTLAMSGGFPGKEGDVVRAAADGYTLTRRGGAWVPE